MTQKKPERNWFQEGIGWIQIASLIFIFPALYYLCVFFPIVVGWAPRFP